MATLRAETADGRPIAGVRGWWSTSVRGGPVGNMKVKDVALVANPDKFASEIALQVLREGEFFLYGDVDGEVLELRTAVAP